MIKKYFGFKNQKKEKDTQPDYKLVAIDDNKEGNDKFINLGGAWVSKDKKGNPMMSFKLNEKNEYNEGWSLVKDEVKEEGVNPDDIPFNEV